jgi:ribonuclease HI
LKYILFSKKNNRRGGWGFVVRNKNVDVLAAGAENITYVASALQAEAIAVYQSVLHELF